MKTLKPHPHVIKLLGCVTESGRLLFKVNCLLTSTIMLQLKGRSSHFNCAFFSLNKVSLPVND